MMGEKKVIAEIQGVKVTAVIRWQGLTEKTKSQFNEELARQMIGGQRWKQRDLQMQMNY